jgi:putative endonuclease
MDTSHYWVYILLCENNTYYTGYTNDLLKRYDSHVNGTGRCKYTRSFKPVKIVQCWRIDGDKSLAMQLERDIKKMTRPDKDKLIMKPSSLTNNPLIKPVSKGELRAILSVR